MLKMCFIENMSTVIAMNNRGTLTIPKILREKYDLGPQVILEETEEGLTLRPAVTYPIEIYTDKRIMEFQKQNEEALGEYQL